MALATPAAARYGFQTVALTNQKFEVIPRGRTDIDGYWCAASDFARRTLGAGWQQQIYVARGYGPSEATGRRTAVQFSLSDADLTAPVQQSSFSSGFRVGESMSVQRANARCDLNILVRP